MGNSIMEHNFLMSTQCNVDYPKAKSGKLESDHIPQTHRINRNSLTRFGN